MRRHSSTGALKSFRVNGETYEIHVSSSGRFFGTACGEHFEAETLREVERNMRRVAKKMKREVAVEAMLIGAPLLYEGPHSHKRGQVVGRTCIPVTITGIDWRSNELKYRGPDGLVMKRRRFGDEAQFGKRMTDEQVAEWRKLREAKREAQDAFSMFEREFQYNNIEKVVQKAISELVDDPKEAEEAPTMDTADPR